MNSSPTKTTPLISSSPSDRDLEPDLNARNTFNLTVVYDVAQYMDYRRRNDELLMQLGSLGPQVSDELNSAFGALWKEFCEERFACLYRDLLASHRLKSMLLSAQEGELAFDEELEVLLKDKIGGNDGYKRQVMLYVFTWVAPDSTRSVRATYRPLEASEPTHVPREFTAEEVRQQLYWATDNFINYWFDPEIFQGASAVERARNLMASFFSMLDGSNAGMPKFILATEPHPDDRGYDTKRGMNWMPENHERNIKCDLAGELRTGWDKYEHVKWPNLPSR